MSDGVNYVKKARRVGNKGGVGTFSSCFLVWREKEWREERVWELICILLRIFIVIIDYVPCVWCAQLKMSKMKKDRENEERKRKEERQYFENFCSVFKFIFIPHLQFF